MKQLLLAALLLATTPAFAANSATLTIGGTLKPRGCDISLPSGNSINYGLISANKLDANAASTPFDDQSFNINISCTENASVSVTLLDNRASSLVSNGSGHNFGLGYADSAKTQPIGGLKLFRTSDTSRVDGYAKGSLGSSDGVTWSCADNSGLANKSRQSASSAASCSTVTTLASGKQWVIPLQSQVMVTKKTDLPNAERISIDGSITLELTYY